MTLRFLNPDDIGCFTLWYTKQSQCDYQMLQSHFVPESPATVNVRYYLYNAVHTATYIDYNTDLSAITIYPTQPVRFIIHGLNSNENISSLVPIKNALRVKASVRNNHMCRIQQYLKYPILHEQFFPIIKILI